MRLVKLALRLGLTVVAMGLGVGCEEPATETSADAEQPEDGKADLPNGQFFEREHDGSGYRVIAAHFEEAGFDVAVDLEQLMPQWPMRNGETALLDRFGTPLLLWQTPYFHTALDVLRADPTTSAEVFAPVSGPAGVFDWSGNRGAGNSDYSTVVAIYDEQSGAVVQLMHVQPTEELLEAGRELIDVQAGERIGTLASTMSWFTDPNELEAFRHTHVSIIDGENIRSLDAARFMPYLDDTPLELVDAYLLDDDALRHDELVTGRLDLVLEVFDRDETSDRNFEVDAFAFEILDDQGNVLRSIARCEVDDLYADNSAPYRLRTLQLLDFGNAADQVDGSWPNSDIGNRERTFRYALTQLTRDEEGQCDVIADPEGFVDIPEATQWIEVRGTMWDVRDNATPLEVRIERGEPE